MNTVKVTRDSLAKLIEDTHGAFFTVAFTKRTTGEVRVMRATLNYSSALAGGEAKYDARERGLIVVRDMDATRAGVPPIRSINLDGVLWVKANGNTYEVTS